MHSIMLRQLRAMWVGGGWRGGGEGRLTASCLIDDDLMLILLAAQPGRQLEVIARLQGRAAQGGPHHLCRDADPCPYMENLGNKCWCQQHLGCTVENRIYSMFQQIFLFMSNCPSVLIWNRIQPYRYFLHCIRIFHDKVYFYNGFLH